MTCAVVVGVHLPLLGATVAGAQGADPPADDEATEDGASLRVVVSGLTQVLGPGSVAPATEDLDAEGLPTPREDLELRVLVENDGTTTLDNLQLVIEVYDAAPTRASLRGAFEGRPVGLLLVHAEEVRGGGSLGPGEIATIEDVFGRDEVAWHDEGGVHPVRVAVQRGTEVIDEVVTAAVWLADLPTAPVLTTFVWPVDDVPWRTTGGDYPATVDRALRPGGRLDVLVRTLERHPDAPIVLAVAPHLLEDLQDRADGYTALHRRQDGSLESHAVEPEDDEARASNQLLQRLRQLAATLPHDPIVSSYADSDIAALLAEGGSLADLAAEAATESRRRLLAVLDRPPDRSTHLVGGILDGRAVDLLRSEHLILPYHTVLGPDPATDPDLPEALRPLRSDAGGLLTAAVGDPYLTAALTEPPGDAGPLVDAHRILADTAMVYFEAPSVSRRSLVILPPEIWSPEPMFVRELLDDLLDATWIEFTDPSDQATRARRATGSLELVDDALVPIDRDFAEQLTTALGGLEAAQEALPAESATIDGRDPADLRDALLRATSRRHVGAGAAEAAALVRDVSRAVDVAFGDVVIASGSQVTLTSDTGQIPITLQRVRGGPIQVQIEVASQGRLVWPDGRRSETILLEDDSAQTVTLSTRALSTGTFPVTVRVTDPSGWYELDRTTLSVRSENVSGVALSGTVGAVLVLLLIGVLRRRRRPRLAIVDEGSRSPTPPADDS